MRAAPILFVLLTLVCRSFSSPNIIKIGAIFHNGAEEDEELFDKAIHDVSANRLPGQYVLEAIIKRVDVDTDTIGTAKAACELLEAGVAAIFGPKSPYTRPIVSSIATRHDIPHIEYSWRPIEESAYHSTTTNVYPASRNISQALAVLTQAMPWTQFTAIYETDDGLSRIQEALKLHGPSDSPITVRRLGEGSDHRSLLKEIAASREVNMILDARPENIMEILKQANEMNLMRDYHTWIISDLDFPGYAIRNTFMNSKVNITGFGLMTEKVNQLGDAGSKSPRVKLEPALLYDAVMLFSRALASLKLANAVTDKPLKLVPVPIKCGSEDKYSAGRNLTVAIRSETRVNESTGPMGFDDFGHRQTFELQIMEFHLDKIITIGVYSRDGLTLTRSEKEREEDMRKKIESTSYRVTTRIGPPFLMEVIDGSNRGVLIGDKRYEGFSVDLIAEVARVKNFTYHFELVPDGNYGSYNDVNKSWDGLLKRLLDHEADLAICDLTINHQREQAVDFTMPFMNLGISILFSKPPEVPPNLFSFLSPFSSEVWIYVAGAYIGVSVMLFLLARIAPGEWDNPHPCNPDPEELENSFNLMNSMWLTIGSLMQQGSDILPKYLRYAEDVERHTRPEEANLNLRQMLYVAAVAGAHHLVYKQMMRDAFSLRAWLLIWIVGRIKYGERFIRMKAPSIRMVAGMWWFFVLIMVQTYTANLAAFLTTGKMGDTISSAEELAAQTAIKYGAVKGGSTSMFFKDSNNSVYQRMWAAMNEARPSVFTKDNDEGVDRVLSGKRGYAFIMESTFIEYNVERHCELEQIGGLLDNKGYGIAMPPNSAYRTEISKAVLTLQEQGILERLKTKWWKEMNIEKVCPKDDNTEKSSELELRLDNVGGMFLVLGCGCAASLVVGILEFLWNVRKVAVHEKVTPREAFMAELKFAVNIWAEKKPVKVSQSRDPSTARDGGGIGRAASVARSMVGSFLRLDMLDKLEKDNASNPKRGRRTSH